MYYVITDRLYRSRRTHAGMGSRVAREVLGPFDTEDAAKEYIEKSGRQNCRYIITEVRTTFTVKPIRNVELVEVS